MKSRTIWALIIIVAFGVSVELIRDAGPLQETEVRERIDLDQETSYDLSFSHHTRPKFKAVRVRPNIEQYRKDRKAWLARNNKKGFRKGQLAKVEFKHGKKKKKGEKSKKKAVKKKAKKKKDDKKKKKKEDGKETSIAEEEIRPESEDVEEKEETVEEPINNGGSAVAAAPAGGAIPPQQKAPIDRDLQEWLDILLPSPSFRETDRFISAFRLGQVTEPTFHEVINQMLDDNRDSMNSLAIRALAAAPSVRSFDTIVSVINDNFAPAVIQSATQSLNAYENPRNLSILQKVLISGVEASTKKVAITKISLLARDFTDVQGLGTLDTNNNFVNPNAASLELIFESLQTLNFSVEDAELARIAQDLQQYLSDNFNFINS